ncbi:MAG: serine/threonine-protein kinase [Bradymonadaceae bacterium]
MRSEPTVPERPPAGSQLGNYELLTKFATGGMAELYLARERGPGGLERVVVIKRLLPEKVDDPSSVDMFLREARLAARLNHPNVVQIYELGEEGGEYFLAMEYLHGSTLRELRELVDERDREFPLDLALLVADQACRGLHAAHELTDFEGELVELIHRDVSPHNLMCTTEGNIKLLDFGVAKAAEGEESTQSGNIKGKFAYMSPEQLEREELDRRSDIFALGAVIWELCVGRRLFERDSELDTMKAITEEPIPPPSLEKPSVPNEVSEAVARALKRDRADRYETVEQFRGDLQEAARQRGLVAEKEDLAAFVEELAGDRLEEREATLRRAMEDSELSRRDRAKLRHGQDYDRTSDVRDISIERGSPSTPEPEKTAVESPGESTPTASTDPGRHGAGPPAGGEGRSTGRSPPGDSRDSRRPTSRAAARDSGDDRPAAAGESAETGDGLQTLQLVLLGSAIALLTATGIWAYLGLDTTSEQIGPDRSEGGAASGSASDESGGPDRPTVSVSGEPLRFGWSPIATEEVLRKEIEPVRAYLRRKLQRPVKLVIPETYEKTGDMLASNELDFAVLTPLLYVRTKFNEPDIQPLATRQFDGAVTSDGLILTRSSSDFLTLEDLKGETFCFTDENSTTGNFLPQAFMRERGHDPSKFIGEIHWSGDHVQVLKDLMAEKCAAAATYSGSFLTAEKYGVSTGQLRTVAVTGHVPQGTVTGSPKLPRPIAKRIREILIRLDPEAQLGTKVVGDTLRLTGFSETSDKAFDKLRELVEENRDLLEKF